MKIKVIGTGSKGNCYVVTHGGETIVLDAGCNFSCVQKAVNYMVMDISFCLVTHKHSDHVKFVKQFVNHGIPVISNSETVNESELKSNFFYSIPERKWYKKDDILVLPFFVPHDGVDNYAYIIKFPDGETLFYATDYEYIKYNLKPFQIKHYLVECNHSEEVSEESANYGHVYLGHASLNATESFLRQSICDITQSIALCHLSDVNADRERILATIRNIDETIRVEIAENGKEYNYE